MSKCKDDSYQKDDAVDYCGNGLLKFAKKSFCLDGACNDVTICLLKTETDEEKFYLPVIGSLNKSKEMVYYFSSQKRVGCSQLELYEQKVNQHLGKWRQFRSGRTYII